MCSASHQEQEYLVISPSKEVIMALLKILRSDVRFADTGLARQNYLLRVARLQNKIVLKSSNSKT